jgi:hypothetical protein
MRFAVVASLAVCCPAGVALADPAEDAVRRAANNAGHEMTECAAYFGVVAQGLRQTPGETFQKTSADYEQLMKNAVAFALNYAELINQKPEAVQARLKLSIEDMMSQMDRDYVNVSILMAKYAEPCRNVMDDPEARLNHWISKAEQ